MLYRKLFSSLLLTLSCIIFATSNANADEYSPCGTDFKLAGYAGGTIELNIAGLSTYSPFFLPTPDGCYIQVINQTFKLVQSSNSYILPDQADRIRVGSYTLQGTVKYMVQSGQSTSQYWKTFEFPVEVKPLVCTASLNVRAPGTTSTPGASFGTMSPAAYCSKVSETITVTGPDLVFIGSNWESVDFNYGLHQVSGILRYVHNYPGADTKVRTITRDDSFIFYDRDKPEVSFVTPDPGSSVDGNVNFLISAIDTSGIRKVELYKHTGNGLGELIATDSTFPYNFNINAREYISTNTTLHAVAYDKAKDIVGHTADNFQVASAVYTIDTVNSAPTFVISKSLIVGPATGILTFQYYAADVEGIYDIKFYVDGRLAETVYSPQSGYRQVSIDSSKFSNGIHTVSGILVDTGGKSASDSFSIRFDNNESIAPDVLIVSPPTGQRVSGLITVEASAFDNSGIQGVEFDLNGLILGTASAQPYQMPIDTTKFANGVYTVHAIAYDRNGNTATDKIFIAIDNTTNSNAPIVAIFEPQDESVVSGPAVYVNAIATDDISIKSVDFIIDDTVVGTRDLPPFTFRFDSTKYADGDHTLTVRARDYNENVSDSTITLLVDNSLPAPEIIGEYPYDQGGYVLGEEEQLTMDTFEAVSTAMNSHVDGIQKKGSIGSGTKELRMAIKDQLQKLVKLVSSFKSTTSNKTLRQKAPVLAKRMKRSVLALFRKKARKNQGFNRLKRKAKRSINKFMSILHTRRQ